MTMRFSRRDLPPQAPLVDAHVHLRSQEGLSDLASAGIAAARDAGTPENALPDQPRPRRGPGGPILVWSGWALYRPGGYGSRIGLPARGAGAIQEQIRRLKTAGAGIIKVIASGIVSLKHPGTITEGGYAADELALIVQEASGQGLGVMAHANGENAIIACAQAGVRSVEHGFFMTRRAADLLAERGTFWVPTVGALERAAQGEGVSPKAKDFVSRLVQEQVAMIGYARSVGVPLAVGTDCVLPDRNYAVAYDAELDYFVQAGLSGSEVGKLACEGGAKLLGFDRPLCP